MRHLLVSLLLAVTVVPAAGASQKTAAWAGEKVVILGWDRLRCPQQSAPQIYLRKPNGKVEDAKRPIAYIGQKGTITAVGERYADSATLRLENGETVEVWGLHFLGFDAELEAAKAMVGRPIWARTEMSLDTDATFCAGGGAPLAARRFDKLMVSGAEFCDYQQHVCLQVRNENGVAGWLRWIGGAPFAFLERVTVGSFARPFQDVVYTSDPRSEAGGVDAAARKQIEQGIIAEGMAMDVARLSCHDPLRQRGFAIDVASDQVSTLYRCSQPRADFLVRAGKVIKVITD